MLKRRLYVQIYVTIIASLVTVVLVSGIVFSSYGRDQFNRDGLDIVSKLVWMTLPDRSASGAAQQKAVDRLGHELGIDISLFDEAQNLIVAYGTPIAAPELSGGSKHNWRRLGRHSTWAFRLPDERWLVADVGKRGPRYPFFLLLTYLALISLAVLLVAYPFVRKLTKRLEHLQRGVEKIGAGDLSARIHVKGRDEVASLAQSFNHAASQIEQLVQSNKMLLANASHELRTPLSRIRLGVELMKDGGTPKRFTALQKDIAELDELIGEILLMSRLDAAAEPKLGDTVDLLALAAEECTHYENCTLDGVDSPIQGDAQLLQRLLRNLLDNAAKHGEPPIHIQITNLDNKVTLSVTDAGDGISPKDRDHVLEPFYRASSKQNVEGYGLGLALVNQIARSHGATVEVVLDGSSTIRVTFPAVSDPSPK